MLGMRRREESRVTSRFVGSWVALTPDMQGLRESAQVMVERYRRRLSVEPGESGPAALLPGSGPDSSGFVWGPAQCGSPASGRAAASAGSLPR